MAKLKKEEIIEAIKEMTILELNELVESIKEEFGVDPTAVAAAPATEATEEEGPSTVTIELKDAGSAKLGVIKLVREITGLGLKEAKDLTDNGGVIKEEVSAEEGEEIKGKFEEAGATVEVK